MLESLAGGLKELQKTRKSTSSYSPEKANHFVLAVT
jgi:hypothetical protein